MYSDFKDTLKKTDFNSTFLAMYIDKLDRQNSSIFTFDQDRLNTKCSLQQVTFDTLQEFRQKHRTL
jgi:hypothetical protein